MAIKTPAEIQALVIKKAGKGVAAASFFYQGRVKEVISVPAPRKITYSSAGVKYYRATTRATPGAPPRKISGRLRASIAVEINKGKMQTTGRIGTNVVYSRMLELGGHPYLVPTLQRYRGQIRTIVAGVR